MNLLPWLQAAVIHSGSAEGTQGEGKVTHSHIICPFCLKHAQPWIPIRIKKNVLKCLRYREEVRQLAVQQLLQLALVQFIFVPIIPRVVVENRYQRVHRALELARHSAGGMIASWKMKAFYDSRAEREAEEGEASLPG